MWHNDTSSFYIIRHNHTHHNSNNHQQKLFIFAFKMEHDGKGRLSFHQTKFNRPLTERQEDELFTAQVRSLFKSQKWVIWPYTFKVQKWERILELIGESPAQELIIKQFDRTTIVQQISAIAFPSLQILVLSKDALTNIQILQHLRAPNMKSIDLSLNLITNISTLRRVNFPKLQSINFQSNLIVSYQPLKELNFYGRVDDITLQMYVGQKAQSQDLTWLAKLNTSELSILEIWSKSRTKQTLLLSMIKHKYPLFQVNLLDQVD